MIYDWESYASSRRQHLKCNILIIIMVVINIAALVTFESSNVSFWMLNVLSIPATISLFLCLNDFRGQAEYEGITVALFYPGLRGSVDSDPYVCFWPILLKKSAPVSAAEKYAPEIEICTFG